jgi:tRNA (Thr-GGU) A37 N-methylase
MIVVPFVSSRLSSVPELLSNAQNVMESLRGLRRSSSIALYLILIEALVKFSLLSVAHFATMESYGVFASHIKMAPNFYEFSLHFLIM